MKKVRYSATILLIILYLFLIIFFSQEMSVYILNSIKSCITIIIPSLYIFMIISDFIITSNIYAIFAKPFSFISRYVLKIPEQFFPIYIISNIGGYPVGAKLITDMLKNNKIDRITADNMMMYCYLSGPAFIFGIVGTNIFSDIKVGILIFTSIVLSNFIIAAIIGANHNIPERQKIVPEIRISIEELILSVYNGGKSILKICAIIVFFSSIICIAENSGLISILAKWIDYFAEFDYATAVITIKTFIEISNISLFTASLNNIPLITSLLSFGGICIILQVKSINSSLSLKRFLLFRVISMILSYLICKLFYFITYDFLLPAYSSSYIPHGQKSPIITVFLLIMTILFLLKFSIEKEKEI